ncbi:MAG: hypothetical protein HRU40_01900 [Saprospiraceae bacterium]|nr:hypothetical protein [Saprospiraceae bacterium]
MRDKKTKQIRPFWEIAGSWIQKSVSDYWLIGLGHLGFFCLLIGSQVYVRERMLHFDSVNYLFNLIWSGSFYIEHNRLINILTQWPVLQAIQAGWSLEQVARLYSLWLAIGGYAVFVVVTHVFKSTRGGILLLLMFILTIRYKYYAPVSELMQSLAFIGLAMGWLLRPANRWPMGAIGNVCIFFLLSAPLVITHPFALLSLGVAYGIWWFGTSAGKDKVYILLPLALFGVGLLFWFLYTRGFSDYESDRLQTLWVYIQQMERLPELYIWNRFIWFLKAHYPLTIAIYGIVLFLLLRQRRASLVIMGLIGFALIALLAMLTHAYLDAPIYLMFDGYLGHLGVPMGMVFVLAFGQNVKRYSFLLLVVLVGFSLHRISSVHTFFAKREAILTGIMDAHSDSEHTKLLAHMDAWDWKRLWYPWAIGMETLMMSTWGNPEVPKTVYFEEYGQPLEYVVTESGYFLGMHMRPKRFLYEERPVYFARLSDAPYHRIWIKDAY